MTQRKIESGKVMVRQVSWIEIIRDGARMARKSMRQDAMAWRLAVQLEAAPEWQHAALERAVAARDVSKMLHAAYQDALREELGW